MFSTVCSQQIFVTDKITCQSCSNKVRCWVVIIVIILIIIVIRLIWGYKIVKSKILSINIDDMFLFLWSEISFDTRYCIIHCLKLLSIFVAYIFFVFYTSFLLIKIVIFIVVGIIFSVQVFFFLSWWSVSFSEFRYRK